MLVIPLALSAFAHIWNPVGFPSIHTDEGHYTRRGIHVSEGLGPREVSSRYDHPYFGWLFLGSVFSIINYPDSINAKPGDTDSVEAVWSIPRIIMGLIAVADTFLVYKIAQTSYNRNIAFIAAVLFAVMPYCWLTRRVFLESILLPLVLLSIYFAISLRTRISESKGVIRTNHNSKVRDRNEDNNFRQMLLVSISGIFLGLAIFTKIPSFTFIPLIGFLVYIGSRNNQQNEIKDRVNIESYEDRSIDKKKRLGILALWFIPVIFIPLIWLTFAISHGQYDDWIEGINFQVARESKPLLDNIKGFYSMDPILLILGVAGIGYSVVIKREFQFLIWIGPFLVFLYIIDYVSSFFLVPLIPPLCIAAALMIYDLSSRLFTKKKRINKLLPYGVILVIAVFGLTNTTALILNSENSNYLQLVAAVTMQLPAGNSIQDGTDTSHDDRVTVIGDPRLYWILQYVYDRPEFNYRTQYNLVNKQTLEDIKDGTEKVIMIADKGMMEMVSGEKQPDNDKAAQRAERFSEIYLGTKMKEKVGNVEVRTNY